MTTDQIIALAASIGSCLAAVATFMTVLQIAKQRRAAYRPELVPLAISFRASIEPGDKTILPDYWVRVSDAFSDEKSEADTTWMAFTIPLMNIGLGAAKNIRASWSFAIEEFAHELNELAHGATIPTRFDYEPGSLSMQSPVLGPHYSAWSNQQKQTVDYVLPIELQREPKSPSGDFRPDCRVF